MMLVLYIGSDGVGTFHTQHVSVNDSRFFNNSAPFQSTSLFIYALT